jgi:hypothetical protein
MLIVLAEVALGLKAFLASAAKKAGWSKSLRFSATHRHKHCSCETRKVTYLRKITNCTKIETGTDNKTGTTETADIKNKLTLRYFLHAGPNSCS